MQVLNSTLPIYLVMAIGYLAVRRLLAAAPGRVQPVRLDLRPACIVVQRVGEQDPREVAAPTPRAGLRVRVPGARDCLGVVWARVVWGADLTKAAWV